MADKVLQVRSVPEEVVRELKVRAAREGVPLQVIVVRILTESVKG